MTIKHLLLALSSRLAFLGCASLVLSGAGCGAVSEPSETNRSADAGAVSCPQVDYCALRCSGQETPLYPPHCAIPSCGCAPVPARDDWAGDYHVEGKVDALNLALEDDGTFHWTIEGCDFGGADCGTWQKTQTNAIRLLPSPGSSTFDWIGDGALPSVAKLDVVGEANGDLVVNIPSHGEKPSAQRWTRGRVCAQCGGQAGPTGLAACDEPIEKTCRSH